MNPPLWPGQRPTLLSRAARLALKAWGWTPVLAPPPGLKFVAAVAPHTSNSDFWAGLLWKMATRSPARFIGKRELFQFPLGVFMRAVGGIPLNRANKGANFVSRVAATIGQEPEIALIIAPEGTRAHAPYWKTGFYYMALEAGVPIGIMALDWGHKRVGLVGYLTPTGDIEADFAVIRHLLQGVQGHTPADAGPIEPRPAPVVEVIPAKAA